MSNTKERINLAVSAQTKDKIEAIQTRLDLASLTEVIRRSISALDVLSEYQDDGYSITLKKGAESIEIKLV